MRDIAHVPRYGGSKGDSGQPLAPADRSKEDNVETNIIGIGVTVSERFRDVVDEKAERIVHLAPRAQRLDIKVTRRLDRQGRKGDETVELTLVSKGPVVRAEAVEGDKFTALDNAIDKLSERLRRAKGKREDARDRGKGAHFEKESGSLAGIDVEPASVEVLQRVATGSVGVVDAAEPDEADYTPVVIREKEFAPEWMTSEEAVDRMELVGHDFFLFIDSRTDHPSVVYRRKGWDYGVIGLAAVTPPVVVEAVA